MMFDTSGEAFQSVSGVTTYARYVKRSNAVIWLISLENVESPEELDRVLTVYLQALAEMKSEANKQELIVVLTKGDLLLNSEKVPELPTRARDFLMEHQLDPRADSWQLLDHLSKDLRNWMLKAGYHQFVNRAKDSFAAVHYSIVSAQGADATDGELTFALMPRGVLAPLFWLWRQLAPPVWVDAPGDGGRQLFLSLEDALEESPPGATIHLAAATYALKRSLQLRKSVTIVGKGMAQTIIRAQTENCVLAFGSPRGRFEATDVMFQHSGNKPADVLRLVRGEVLIRRCGFSGGVSGGKETAGDGLVLAKDVHGVVHESRFFRNQGCGVSVRDQSRVRLEKNDCRLNDASGIQCFGDGQPTVVGNNCIENQSNGIRLGGSTLARVTGNTCQENKRAGISCSDSAQPELRGNQCVGNGLNGIQVKNDAKPTIEANSCQGNKASGIAFNDAVLGTVRDNDCVENAHCGLVVVDQTRVDAEGNRCHRNGQHGIWMSAGASGSIRGNQCFGNTGCGVNVDGQADPAIEDNECSGNQGHGVCVASTVGKIRLRGTTGKDNRGELVRDFRKKGWFG
jgi:parallel beta-helix repeat protein